MKTLNALFISLVLILAAAICEAQTSAPAKPVVKPVPTAQSKSTITPVVTYDQIKAPKLPDFHPQAPERFVLPNGMVVFLQVDHELPLIDGFVRIRGGSREVS